MARITSPRGSSPFESSGLFPAEATENIYQSLYGKKWRGAEGAVVMPGPGGFRPEQLPTRVRLPIAASEAAKSERDKEVGPSVLREAKEDSGKQYQTL